MKVGVIADTHDHLENIDRALFILKQKKVKLICHLGDWISPYTANHVSRKIKEIDIPLKGVLGNNDRELFFILSKNPAQWNMELASHTLTLNIDGKKIILYHGTDPDLTRGLIEGGAFNAVLSGHTHEPRNERIKSTLALNPGTLSGYSYSRDGKIGQGELAIYSTDKNQAELLTFPII